MDNSNKKNTTLENNPCKEKYLVTAESCEKEQISENIVTSSELSSILPRIRVRRFSGDKLSGRIIDSTKSCEATLIKTELKQDSNNEEPFTFIISDVKTIPVNDISVVSTLVVLKLIPGYFIERIFVMLIIPIS